MTEKLIFPNISWDLHKVPEVFSYQLLSFPIASYPQPLQTCTRLLTQPANTGELFTKTWDSSNLVKSKSLSPYYLTWFPGCWTPTSPAGMSSGSPFPYFTFPASQHRDTRLYAVCSQITFLSSRLKDFSIWMLPTSEMQCAQILFLPYFLLLVSLASLMVPPTTNTDNNNNKTQNKTKQAKTSGHLLLSPPTSLLNGHHLLLFQTGLSWSHCATISSLLLFDSTNHFSSGLFQQPPTSRPTSNTLSKVVREKDKSDYAAPC